nr:hypothetical protein [uncultured Hyphomonas sp.]
MMIWKLGRAAAVLALLFLLNPSIHLTDGQATFSVAQAFAQRKPPPKIKKDFEKAANPHRIVKTGKPVSSTVAGKPGSLQGAAKIGTKTAFNTAARASIKPVFNKAAREGSAKSSFNKAAKDSITPKFNKVSGAGKKDTASTRPPGQPPANNHPPPKFSKDQKGLKGPSGP